MGVIHAFAMGRCRRCILLQDKASGTVLKISGMSKHLDHYPWPDAMIKISY